jgi:hypothetical protein
MYEFTVTYTEDIARRAARAVSARAIRRLLDWKLCAALVVTIAFLVAVHPNGELSWLEGAVGTLVGVLLALSLGLYRANLRRSLSRLRRMKSPTGRIVVTDETLTVSSELGSSTLPWSGFTGTSEHAGFWVLNTAAGAGLTLPTGDVSADALEFIRRKLANRRSEV